jgi:hypothetical protein
MDINNLEFQNRLIIITGNFGSGKTEVAVNLSIELAKHYPEINIADLDVVNPYFRCREAKKQMEEHNVTVVIPEVQYFYADLPIVTPRIRSVLNDLESKTILDVGGDPVGARILRSFHNHLVNSDYDFFFVVNKNRPFSDTLGGCRKLIKDIEEASELKITGLISGTHLIEETSIDMIYDGYEFTRDVSNDLGIPISFVTIMDDLFPKLDRTQISEPILVLKRLMLPPWLKGEDLLGLTNLQGINKIKGA